MHPNKYHSTKVSNYTRPKQEGRHLGKGSREAPDLVALMLADTDFIREMRAATIRVSRKKGR